MGLVSRETFTDFSKANRIYLMVIQNHFLLKSVRYRSFYATMSLRLLVALTLVGLAAASCPDDCSGHGACARNDKCSCYSNWEGINCALRTFEA